MTGKYRCKSFIRFFEFHRPRRRGKDLKKLNLRYSVKVASLELSLDSITNIGVWTSTPNRPDNASNFFFVFVYIYINLSEVLEKKSEEPPRRDADGGCFAAGLVKLYLNIYFWFEPRR